MSFVYYIECSVILCKCTTDQVHFLVHISASAVGTLLLTSIKDLVDLALMPVIEVDSLVSLGLEE